mmetsp:Transcript_8578/g.27516  ORF Transcript_8578/g.27516 Transcript_8578/m.27516 type:complete len:217 (-) Transcript_8578:238-888(-)
MISLPSFATRSKISIVAFTFLSTNASTNIFFVSAQFASASPINRIKLLSNAAKQNICKGLDIFTSSSVIAGYFLLSKNFNRFATPSFSSNAYANHARHHFASSLNTLTSAYDVVTHGRHFPFSLFVVSRSGIEHNRFAPMSPSSKKSLKIFLSAKCFSKNSIAESHSSSVQESSIFMFMISLFTSSNISFERISFTLTSCSRALINFSSIFSIVFS